MGPLLENPALISAGDLLVQQVFRCLIFMCYIKCGKAIFEVYFCMEQYSDLIRHCLAVLACFFLSSTAANKVVVMFDWIMKRNY